MTPFSLLLFFFQQRPADLLEKLTQPDLQVEPLQLYNPFQVGCMKTMSQKIIQYNDYLQCRSWCCFGFQTSPPHTLKHTLSLNCGVKRPFALQTTNPLIAQTLSSEVLTVHVNELRLFWQMHSLYSNYLCHTPDIAAVGTISKVFSFDTCLAKI